MAKLLSTVKSALSSTASIARQEQRRREQPVGNSRIVQNLKQRMLDLRETSNAVFLNGPHGSGRRIWADYLSESAGGMDIFDGSQSFRRLIPLRRNLFVEEIADLDRAQQSALHDAILVANRDSKHRVIVSSSYGYDELRNKPEIDPRLAGMFQDAIKIPSLEEHIEDIPELLEYYANWISDHEQLPYRHFNVAAQNLLRNHRWTDDIDQLKKFIRTILTNSDTEEIDLDEIEHTLGALDANFEADAGNKLQITIDMDLDLREAREAFEREYLSRHLALSGNNMTELARRVGQERTHLYRKLKSLGLQTKKQ
ncbi:MAG: hypothetical protein OEN02_08555 [Gammaproteobacteria bacterium]|nr:hypothetical protein [Gammaproteobacteria bacterium]MDH3534370.1 hypothetical protein [Gammaproteobacteria bacterium]